ncbi:hypothetical protein [Paenibacillus sp. UNC451MF]|uniref:hypothetical protein n=1 Tax=Paenibacillus sp. UNC451MF TaxID=1449063 RepID=UPI000A7CF92B|nr:hypothetical protein [Paenibacillus sp. UNC451MF]
MEIDALLNELFSSQEDWSVKTNEHSYVIVPNGNKKEEEEEEEEEEEKEERAH